MDSFELLERVAASDVPLALATVSRVSGHAYRKAGAAMLLASDGSKFGSISPGCLEEDLQERVAALLEEGKPQIVTYDMRPEEDAVWGDAIGCGGVVTVLLEPVTGTLQALLNEARLRVSAGERLRLERSRSGEYIRYRLMPGGEEPRAADDGEAGLADIRLEPRPRLLLFGAGEDAVPICEAALRIGFLVTVADWRAGRATSERFPHANLIVGTADEIVRGAGLGSDDYVLLCGHQLRKDREMLEAVLPLHPVYIGVMGSRKRIDALFEGLQATPAVHAPVGLAIGADGPNEIAVSIAAELIACRASGAAG
ncbi:MAG TPA: XdhC family protein [Paenibacillus sp.]|uniref:XdhC family protein n=1 Tax=Paenibacillus sp. TaxID=58172 RepID=UPI0028D0A306|nr:XdhC family protein [Paenibacillus sp.]HUC90429.1 XdhC family protein [Paenibacillus sp.]